MSDAVTPATASSAASAVAAQAPVIELRDVCKDYGNTRVLYDVNLSIMPGEVVGLVGDNGAGKSTLLKIITGYHLPSAGAVYLAGRPVRFSSPAEARAVGIETVYQDLAIINELSLWRNFFMGKELRRNLGPLRMLDIPRMRQICNEELSKLGLTRFRSPDEPAASLSGGERQSVAITRAMYFGARLLLLDEPTAALSVRETRNVLASIDTARGQGLGIVYIDHNMAHVHPVADRVVLIEHGRVAATLKRGDVSVAELSDLVARTHPGQVQ
ncbi:MAG TPA: ATP-binding cassette domain-containing protein [Chloroflexota bacterium]|nr:ATP-binding cassette domain-containing protein [Chloroflexota bacterium]